MIKAGLWNDPFRESDSLHKRPAFSHGVWEGICIHAYILNGQSKGVFRKEKSVSLLWEEDTSGIRKRYLYDH